LILREMDERIGRMQQVHPAEDLLPKMTPFEFEAVMEIVLDYAGEKTASEDVRMRLAALNALKTALHREAHRSDEEIGVVINGLFEDAVIAQRCAKLVPVVRDTWPIPEIDSLQARFDDKAVPALESNAKRLASDKRAEGSLLDALDNIRYGVSPDMKVGYRRYLEGIKPLRLPLLAQKLRRITVSGDRGMAQS
jgi:hypothetical protein